MNSLWKPLLVLVDDAYYLDKAQGQNGSHQLERFDLDKVPEVHSSGSRTILR